MRIVFLRKAEEQGEAVQSEPMAGGMREFKLFENYLNQQGFVKIGQYELYGTDYYLYLKDAGDKVLLARIEWNTDEIVPELRIYHVADDWYSYRLRNMIERKLTGKKIALNPFDIEEFISNAYSETYVVHNGKVVSLSEARGQGQSKPDAAAETF